MRKSLVLSALMFVVDFFSILFKELKKRNITEEMIFDALKSKKDLIPQMAEKIADLIAGAKTSIQSFFKESGPVKLWLGDNFKNWILSKMPESFEPPKSVKHILPRSMADKEIISEYKIRPYSSVSELLSVIYDKIIKQPNGEEGELLNNGYANIFYVQLEGARVVAVDVDWDSANRGWGLGAYGLVDRRWFDGPCVFSAADL